MRELDVQLVQEHTSLMGAERRYVRMELRRDDHGATWADDELEMGSVWPDKWRRTRVVRQHSGDLGTQRLHRGR